MPLMTLEQLPAFSDLYMLDTVLARLQVTLDDACQKGDIDLRSGDCADLLRALDISAEQLPISGLLTLIQALSHATRWSLLQQMNSVLEEGSKLPPEALDAYCSVLAVSAGHLPRAGRHPPCLTRSALPAPLKTVLDNWNANTMTDFPAAHAWLNSLSGDVLPGESYVSGVVMGHAGTLSAQTTFTINLALKHVMHTLVTFATDLAGWCNDDKTGGLLTTTLISLSADATCDHVSQSLSAALDRLLPLQEGADSTTSPDPFQLTLFSHLLSHVESLLQSGSHVVVDEQILEGCTSVLEELLELPTGKLALDKFLAESRLSSVLLSPPISADVKSSTLPTHIIKFFIKLFQLGE
ncbi:E3 ubiquitin-protein ligase UBR4 [Chionoecetes opilio]|uniref:E3 ubiquitin-protein ligase UBR4 n=1 Tax=Chionoecetes opilio TaxID=41210 RepID=A0A8J4YKI6_CHIOP|nr:E3 ubiquitin-protein ligase UBR4 [Chionoecetes opilio]